MFAKLKNVWSGPDGDQPAARPSGAREPAKYPYSRPHFLQLDDDETQASIDHRLRPIISPSRKLANFAGYAECINGGKSELNEDQAVAHQAVLASGRVKVPYTYFGLFDGHAGVGAAVCAANQLHHVLHQRLVDAQDDLWLKFLENDKGRCHDLIVGALEVAFSTMDDIIKEELVRKQSNGGCTAIVVISILGSVYVANAGDSRAILCSGNSYKALSNDFTPETEKERIQQLAQMKPHLLGKYYTYIEYLKQPKLKDLGKRVLFKDAFMKGWSYKTIVQEDLKPSLITGQGKRSRVMGTIGVTRGFGDHDLLSVYQRIPIKPFLSCRPEVRALDLGAVAPADVLVMATDGLWDVLDGADVAKIVSDVTEIFDGRELYASAATCLVGAARGTLREHQWVTKGGKGASVDDISVFVVPLRALACDHARMERALDLDRLRRESGVVAPRDGVSEALREAKARGDVPSCSVTANLSNEKVRVDDGFLSINLNSIEGVRFCDGSGKEARTTLVRSRSFPNLVDSYDSAKADLASGRMVYEIDLSENKKGQ